VQDNTRLITPLVFHLAPTHLGRGTHRQIYSSVQGPPGSETPTAWYSPPCTPKAARSRWRPTWKANLAFCRVVHRTTTVHVWCLISFLTESSRSLVLGIGWRTGHCLVHTEQSGVPNRPLARPRVVRRLRGRPLALATIGSPDSPVNFSRTPFSFSRGRRVRRG
jgi:hypothetical protein